jgi:hypothetical protein
MEVGTIETAIKLNMLSGSVSQTHGTLSGHVWRKRPTGMEVRWKLSVINNLSRRFDKGWTFSLLLEEHFILTHLVYKNLIGKPGGKSSPREI